MDTCIRTIFAGANQTAIAMGKALTYPEYSTLNQLLDIQHGTAVSASALPVLGYLAIGDGAHQFITGANGRTLARTATHQSTDGGLFNMMPCVLRALDSDLDPLEREKYAMRKEVVYNSVTYIAYYLRKIDLADLSVQMQLKTVTDGAVNTTPWSPTQLTLKPNVPALSANSVNVASGDYVAATCRLNVTFTPSECQEYRNVASIIYGNQDYAVISEMALVSAIPKNVNIVPSVGTAFTFEEALRAQVHSFIETTEFVRYASSFSKNIDIGVNEPLLNITTPVTNSVVSS